ncbi:MAG: GNAT family protein [Halobacteriales archaeon]
MPGALVSAGDRVALRTVEPEDDPFLQRLSANPELRVPMGTPLRSRAELEAALEEQDDGEDRFAVTLESDPVPGQPDGVEMVGSVSVSDADWRRPELTYWLVPTIQGEGYGRESVALAIDYAFRTYDHPGVEAKAYDFNDASRGLLESLGFEREGRLRNRRFVGGEYVDVIWYGLAREDWRG